MVLLKDRATPVSKDRILREEEEEEGGNLYEVNNDFGYDVKYEASEDRYPLWVLTSVGTVTIRASTFYFYITYFYFTHSCKVYDTNTPLSSPSTFYTKGVECWLARCLLACRKVYNIYEAFHANSTRG